LAIIFGLSRYSAASKKRALGICLSPRSYFPLTFSPQLYNPGIKYSAR